MSLRGIALDLAVALVEPLAEVAAAVEEADADERHAELGGGLQVVAGEDAEAARVDGEALVETELGREVGDEAAVGPAPLLPPRRALRLRGQPLLHAAEAQRVLGGQRLAEVVVGELGEEGGRVVSEGAEPLRGELGEERARTGRPAEREVLRRSRRARPAASLRREPRPCRADPTDWSAC